MVRMKLRGSLAVPDGVAGGGCQPPRRPRPRWRVGRCVATRRSSDRCSLAVMFFPHRSHGGGQGPTSAGLPDYLLLRNVGDGGTRLESLFLPGRHFQSACPVEEPDRHK